MTEELVGQSSVYRPFIRYQRDPILVEAGEHVDGWELIAAPGPRRRPALPPDATASWSRRTTSSAGSRRRSGSGPRAAPTRSATTSPRSTARSSSRRGSRSPATASRSRIPPVARGSCRSTIGVRLEETVAALGDRAADRLRAVVRALRRRPARRRAPLRDRRDALAPRAPRAARALRAGTRSTGRLPILPPDHRGRRLPPSTGAPDGA